MQRRRSDEATIFLPWETRHRRLAWLTRRHTRVALRVLCATLIAWVPLEVEARRRAVYVTRAAVADTMRAVEAFRADHDARCPADVAQLLNPGDGNEAYLTRMPRDGWGHTLRLMCPGRKRPDSADVTSPGPSGSFNDLGQIE